MNIKEIREQLTIDNIETILSHVGVEPYYKGENKIIYPTVCHNSIEDDNSNKLYYYGNSKLFTCYTECDHSFDIVELIINIYELSHGQTLTIFDAINIIQDALNMQFNSVSPKKTKDSTLDVSAFLPKEEDLTVVYYNDHVLDLFKSNQVAEIFKYFKEPLSQQTIDKFEVGYYAKNNCLTFPWRDINGELVNIKGRNLDWTPNNHKAKYMPVKIQGVWYKNKVSLMIYGIYQNKHILKQQKQAFIFEGEKSVLKIHDYFNGTVPAVAIGGQNIHSEQVKLLLKTGVNKVFLCFDKDFDTKDVKQQGALLDLIIKKGERLKRYFEVFVLFDTDNLLQKKDSPIDRGQDNFITLWKNRIKI